MYSTSVWQTPSNESFTRAMSEWRITNPRVEYLAEPFALGIDVAAPRFGWVVDPADTATGAIGSSRVCAVTMPCTDQTHFL